MNDSHDATEPPPETAPTTGPIALAVACTDTLADVYVTPPSLPPFTRAERGEIVRCAVDSHHDVADVNARLNAAGVVGVVASSVVTAYRIAYRTERDDGVPGLGTALILVPDQPRAARTPRVVFAHGTAGLADHCAPSKAPSFRDAHGLPFATAGYLVAMPDYAGLGTDGIQGYGRAHDTAHSVLDSARAVRRLLDPARVADEVVLTGHSQGGGAVLQAQAIATSYGVDGEVVGIVSFAGGFPMTVDAGPFRTPNLPTSWSPGGAAISVLSLYAFAASAYGDPSLIFPLWNADLVAGAVEQSCVYELATKLPSIAPAFGDLVRDAVRLQLVSCVDGGACWGVGKRYYDYLTESLVDLDPAGARVLLLQGLEDTMATPKRTACIAEKLAADGVAPQVCTDAVAGHRDIVHRNVAHAMQWIEATLAATPVPTCQNQLPVCE